MVTPCSLLIHPGEKLTVKVQLWIFMRYLLIFFLSGEGVQSPPDAELLLRSFFICSLTAFSKSDSCCIWRAQLTSPFSRRSSSSEDLWGFTAHQSARYTVLHFSASTRTKQMLRTQPSAPFLPPGLGTLNQGDESHFFTVFPYREKNLCVVCVAQLHCIIH